MSLAELYDRSDAVALAALLREGQVSALELVEECIARIERVDPQLNAVVHRMYDLARQQAARPRGDGPFAGVPFLLKDLGTASYAGEPQSFGSQIYDGFVPDEDGEVVVRHKRAGLITVAKTNVPELGISPVTESVVWGPCRNPWNVGVSPGGSSGGAAAAVAAGIVPIASAADGGGSIRIPAGRTGTFGLKPSRGRTPMSPEPDGWQGLVAEHAITRSVRDSAAFLDCLLGPDVGGRHQLPAPERPYREEAEVDPPPLRIAWSGAPLLPADVDPRCIAALHDARDLLAELGHTLIEDRPPLDGEAFALDFLTMVCGELAADLRDAERRVGRPRRRGDIEPETECLVLLGETLPAGRVMHAIRDVKRAGRQVARYFDDAGVDVVLTPTSGTAAPAIGSLGVQGTQRAVLQLLLTLRAGRVLRAMRVLETEAAGKLANTAFTIPYNAAGTPAMSVPLFWDDDDMPQGVQLVARVGDEATLLRLAGQLERARPWADRRPPVWAGPTDTADVGDRNG